jgi:hypothetical protein
MWNDLTIALEIHFDKDLTLKEGGLTDMRKVQSHPQTCFFGI